ncbi:MAG: energy transducer TonB [Pyrinomonadaceae bacterium]
MKSLAKTGLQLAITATLFFALQSEIFAQQDDIAGGTSVFVFKPASSIQKDFTPQQKPRKNERRRIVSKAKSTGQTPTTGSSGKKPQSAVVEPIAPEEWINENAEAAIEERKVADNEPLLFLSEGFLNSRIQSCAAPQFPAAARKAKLKQVRLRVSVTLAKYGGILDAQVIEGDAIFRQAVYDSLGSMQFRQTYFMGEPVRIQGILEFTQHDSDGYNMISCRDAVKEAELPAVIDGGVLNENATACEAPQFPADAKAANLKSVAAKVQVIIDEKGNVISAKPIDGHPAFGQAAAQAAMKATFRRSLIINQPVKVSGIMIFTQTPNNDVPCKNTVAE